MVTEGMITAGAGGSTAGSSSSLPKESDVNINVNPGSVVDESVSDIATSSSSKKKTKKKLRLLVVANRLPISVKRKLSENGSGNEYDLVPSSGGLVTALSGVRAGLGQESDLEFLWFGWPGCEVAPNEREKFDSDLRKLDSVAVYVSDALMDVHYNGFCNGLLWPMLHYMSEHCRFDDGMWKAYKDANLAFATRVAEFVQPGDYVWVHDYHLMLFPSMLTSMLDSKLIPNVCIGWFLHTPWPSSNVVRMLPVCNDLLRGLLGSQLVGFHTYGYARHFVSACTRVLGLDANTFGVEYRGRICSVGVFPVGIDPTPFIEAEHNDEVNARYCELRDKYAGQHVILGIDRVDYIKGIPLKLAAIELLLQKYPQYKTSDKVTLIQIGVPTREDVLEYQELRQNIHEGVGHINSEHGTLVYSPVVYMNKSVKFPELCALYRLADVCLITSIRDGMNLVAFEYIASRTIHDGVLIVSEFAGAAQYLSGGIFVNPFDLPSVTDSIHQALTMSAAERKYRCDSLRSYVNKNTSQAWAKSFVTDLMTAAERNLFRNRVKALDTDAMTMAFAACGHGVCSDLSDVTTCSRLVAVELEEFISMEMTDDKMTLTDALAKLHTISALSKICLVPRTLLILEGSGRSRRELDAVCGDLHAWLIAEHGCFIRRAPKGQWHALATTPNKSEWMPLVSGIMNDFTDRTPGSFVTINDECMSWNYRNVDPSYGITQAREMKEVLKHELHPWPVAVEFGVWSVQVFPAVVHRTCLAQRAVLFGEAKQRPPFGVAVVFARNERILCTYLELWGVLHGGDDSASEHSGDGGDGGGDDDQTVISDQVMHTDAFGPIYSYDGSNLVSTRAVVGGDDDRQRLTSIPRIFTPNDASSSTSATSTSEHKDDIARDLTDPIGHPQGRFIGVLLGKPRNSVAEYYLEEVSSALDAIDALGRV